jgi:DNA-binding transcriptional LysR family regulator
MHDTLAVVAGIDHPLTDSADISVQDLAKYPWVVPRKETPTRDFFEGLFTAANVAPPTQIIESSSLLLIRGLLEESDRLTIISRHQIVYEERQRHLQCLPFDTSNTSRPIGLTTRVDWQPTSSQSALLDLIRMACQNANTA